MVKLLPCIRLDCLCPHNTFYVALRMQLLLVGLFFVGFFFFKFLIFSVLCIDPKQFLLVSSILVALGSFV